MLQRFDEWKALPGLASPRPRDNQLLLIRMDDIGDYLLFRNQLASYKSSARWADHRITLLGNAAWKGLFTLLDAASVDEVIWVDKNRYLQDSVYRTGIWSQLRNGGFDTVIATSRTRPLLIDDLCTLAAAPRQAIGCVNTNVHASWNRLSDGLYGELFEPSDALMHEFRFNADFSRWVCGCCYDGDRPWIERRVSPPAGDAYVIFFVGASIRSKQWPAARWMEFIRLYRQSYSGRIVLAGNGPKELDMVKAIQQQTSAESIAGQVTLAEMLDWVGGAQAVVTNDTMAAHMGASLNRPTVIVANGINYLRFADYSKAGIDNVATIFPDVVTRRRRRYGDGPYGYSETVSADIASIQSMAVFEEFMRLV